MIQVIPIQDVAQMSSVECVQKNLEVLLLRSTLQVSLMYSCKSCRCIWMEKPFRTSVAGYRTGERVGCTVFISNNESTPLIYRQPRIHTSGCSQQYPRSGRLT
jgi:hypothetical protein